MSMKNITLIAAAAFALSMGVPAVAADKTASQAKSSTKKVASKAKSRGKKKLAPGAAKAVEAVTPIAEDDSMTLSEADLAVAKRVYTGKIQCELGADLFITPDEKKPGFFSVKTKTASYLMHPVESRTGAVRLEAPKAGAVWIQIPNKSMLMDTKLGQRLADDCKAPAQVAFTADMKNNPPKALFDGADPQPGASK